MKRLSNDPFIWVLAFVLIFTAFHFMGKLWEENPSAQLHEAQSSYLEAERTKDVAMRKEGFNRSLEKFLALEAKYSPTFGNGKLYFDIGNNFFQLEEYPHALLYYYRAELLRPRDSKVEAHLHLTEKKLGLTPLDKKSAFDWLFFFHTDYSLPERLSHLSVAVLLALIFYSGYMWTKSKVLYTFAIALLSFALLFFASVAYSYLFPNVEGIVIQSGALYRDAGTQYAKVQPEPLLPGTKVRLLNTTMGGKWIKIQTAEGTIGYLPQESLRSITQL